jgi:hypothetical protein
MDKSLAKHTNEPVILFYLYRFITMKMLNFLLVTAFIVVQIAEECIAQNYLATSKETLTFVIDLSGAKINSNIKNDFSALHGMELSVYCERPDLKQALLIVTIDRNKHSNNDPINLFLENAGVSAKTISDNNIHQLQQFFCQ